MFQPLTQKNTEFLLRVGIRCSNGKNILENPRFFVHVTGDDDDNYDDDVGADGNNFEDEVVVRKLDIEPASFF